MKDIKHPKQENEKGAIRKAILYLCLGVLLGLLGFAVLLVGAILDVQHTWGIIAMLAGFFGCAIAGLILFIKALPGLELFDIDRIGKAYGKSELTQLRGMKKQEAKQTLLSHKFQYDESGYYRRKMGSTYYYVKMLDSSYMEKVIRTEWNHLDRAFRNEQGTCLILLIYSNEPTDRNTKLLRNVGMAQIADNRVLDQYSSKTMLTVEVDPVTGVGRYLDIGKGHNLCLYKYGCKMLRKLFRRGQQ